MHLDPVGLRRRAPEHTVLLSIVTQFNYYYPPPEVFHSGSGHNSVIRLLVNLEKNKRDMSGSKDLKGGSAGKPDSARKGNKSAKDDPKATAPKVAAKVTNPVSTEKSDKKKKRKSAEKGVSAAAVSISKIQKLPAQAHRRCNPGNLLQSHNHLCNAS
jgi:hypothetical protein